MSAWLLNNVPSWLLLLSLSVLIAGGAVLIQAIARRRFPGLKGDAQNDVTRFAFTVIAFLYAFLSGFVINAMWGQINGADGRAATEGSAAMQQAKTLVVFDKADGDRISQSLLDYLREADAEWPVVAHGQTYPAADAALQRLYVTYQQVQPRNETQQKFLVVALNNLDKMSAERTERVTVARTDTGPPWSLWLVNFVTSAMVLGCAIIFRWRTIRPSLHDGGGLGPTCNVRPVPCGGTLASVSGRDCNIAGSAERSHPCPVGVTELAGSIVDEVREECG
jgi:hypothetical protein